MRQPNHIILDFFTSNNSNSIKYWPSNIIGLSFDNVPLFLNNRFVLEKTLVKVYRREKIFKQRKFNLKYNLSIEKNLYKLITSDLKFNSSSYSNNLINLMNINFLRKERLYTKLKYSRVASYDLVGGGSALFFGGLLGFLATEKFGIELVDSGDFYYLFMYGVFVVLAFKSFITVINPKRSLWFALSIKPLLEFYRNIMMYILFFFKK